MSVLPVDPVAFRTAVGRFATGVTVVTTVVDGVAHGMTANAFASVSLDPLLILVCVDRATRLHDLLPQAGSFAVTVLADAQEPVSRWFASASRLPGDDQFAGIPWHPAPGSGAPILDEGLAWLDCRLHAVHDGGDHVIFVGEVTGLGLLTDDPPLLWFSGRYRHIPVQPVPNNLSPKSPSPGTM